MTNDDPPIEFTMKQTKKTSGTNARRRNKSGTRERILKVSEKLFSQNGYSGTSLRQIATQANVNLALTYYHFESKSDLFMEVYLRCGEVLISERIKLLEEAEKAAGNDPIPIEEIIRAFFLPALHMMNDRSGRGKSYIRLATRLHNEPKKLMKNVLDRVFDESTVRFVEATKRSLPHLSDNEVYWRLFFMIGIFIYTVSETGRLEAISKGKCSPKDFDETMKQVTPFLIAAFNAPAVSEN